MLPAGASGTVELRYEPEPAYRVALLAGLGLVLTVVVLALVPGRRGRRPAPVGAARIGVRWAWPLAPLAGLWTGGVAGAAVVTLVALAVWWARRVRSAQHAIDGSPLHRFARALLSPWTPAALLALAGLSAAFGASAGIAPWAGLAPELLCLAVLGGIVAAVPGDGPRPAPRPAAPQAPADASGPGDAPADPSHAEAPR